MSGKKKKKQTPKVICINFFKYIFKRKKLECQRIDQQLAGFNVGGVCNYKGIA